ncbi:hypothetical protein [Sandaracinobacteroides hominis]|uniref:hypothetical protein n=1 Tax=Sandaracinobacteroides hominis TaxID=2780086 RepID=UPI0018F37A8D|nr:hypothetical protein [Sandaracinobacteroides hominis]
MGDVGGVRSGRALRVYQILLVLAAGWAVGRLPGWMAETEAEKARLQSAIGLEGVPESGARASVPSDDNVRLAAEVAARVAAGVAEETVARLIAAGWGPRGAEPATIRIEQVPGRPQESVVRVVTEQAPPPMLALDYRLPAGSGAEQVVSKPAADAAPAVPNAAHATATAGYAAIRAGDLREGVRLLKSAQAMAPGAPEAAAWEADVKQLTRRWSLAAYTLSRGGGTGDPLAASPILGGGQSGAAIAYLVNPLGKARVSVVGRVTAAARPDGGIDSETTEAALGLRLQPFRSLPVAVDVERRFALGVYSRNAWAARVSGGTQGRAKAFGVPLKLEGYGEAGVVEGFTSQPDVYGGAQARGAAPLFRMGRVDIDGGAGVWGGVQRSYGVTASRLDLGPSARFQISPWPFTAQVDYRWRAAGNALPGSGPVITVAGEF